MLSKWSTFPIIRSVSFKIWRIISHAAQTPLKVHAALT